MFKNNTKKIMAVVIILLAILAVITAEVIRYLAASETIEPLLVVHDADPGVDDAMAMMMLLSAQSRADLKAVTCVEGNTGVTNGSLNAWLVLQAANRSDIPVHSGTEHALVFSIEGENYFGYDGLGDAFERPLNATLSDQHAAIALVDIVRKHPGKISVLCTGPLTNIALAIHLYPRFLQDVKEVVVLGGSYKGGGNKKPGAEFNFVFDPEAAALVFSKGPSDKLIKLIPLETVESNAIPLDWRHDVLGGVDSNWTNFLNLAESKTLSKITEWKPFDQLAAGVLLNPEVVTDWIDVKIEIETCGVHGRGAVFLNYKSKTSNVRIITGVDIELLKSMLLDLLS